METVTAAEVFRMQAMAELHEMHETELDSRGVRRTDSHRNSVQSKNTSCSRAYFRRTSPFEVYMIGQWIRCVVTLSIPTGKYGILLCLVLMLQRVSA